MLDRNYLCFEAIASTKISWSITGTLTKTPSLQYSLNEGSTWNQYTLGNSISLGIGQKCYWKGTTTTFSESTLNYINFSSTGNVKASGEVDSLINWSTLTDSCYAWMFQNCTSLISPPELPATTLADSCYQYMFKNCTSLTSAPELPATTLTISCYWSMFSDCKSLKLSTTKDSTYKTAYRIPTSGTGTAGIISLGNMFANTGGTFKGTPDINTTYYGAWKPSYHHHKTLVSLFDDIADALRYKTDSSEEFVADAFPDLIINLPSPNGEISNNENGIYDVTQYASANVNVSGGESETCTLTLTKTKNITSGSYCWFITADGVVHDNVKTDGTYTIKKDTFVILGRNGGGAIDLSGNITSQGNILMNNNSFKLCIINGDASASWSFSP